MRRGENLGDPGEETCLRTSSKKREEKGAAVHTPLFSAPLSIMPLSNYCLDYKYNVDFLFREKIGWFSNFKRNAGKMQNIWKILKSMKENKIN